jgi:hypothetical protein
MGPHWDLIPENGSAANVNSVVGTPDQIVALPSTGNVVILIADSPHLPGTGSVGLPKGTTAEQSGIDGSIRFNTQTLLFEATKDGVVWETIQTDTNTVTSISGTTNQIIASASVGDVVISIDPDPRLPGTGSVALPSGTTAEQAGIAGSIRFNTQTLVFESTKDGVVWDVIESSGTGVMSVSGTTNRITSTGGATPVIDIAATYVGQTSITILGVIVFGSWNATTISVPFGGTGNTTFTPYSLIMANTTGTGALQPLVSLGTSGQVLTSNGAGAYPTWQASGGGGGSGSSQFWIETNGAGTSILTSYNVSSIVDNGTGNLTVIFTTQFATSNYVVNVSTFRLGNGYNPAIIGQSATQINVANNNGSGLFTDPTRWYVCGFGVQ